MPYADTEAQCKDMETNNNGPEWLTLADIAAELRVPLATVYRWSSQRAFRTARLGKHVRVRRAWLEEFIDDRAA